jgi:hypothetical protein
MRFLYPFFIILDRFEGCYRAGSGLFFILMMFSFKKNYAYAVKILPSIRNPGLITIRRIFRLRTANNRPPQDK